MTHTLPILQRPRVRAECIDGPRPCPWASCRHHVERTGECALDLASSPERMTLQQVAIRFGPTRERIRQIEAEALLKLRALGVVLEMQP